MATRRSSTLSGSAWTTRLLFALTIGAVWLGSLPSFGRKATSSKQAARRIRSVARTWSYKGVAGRIFPLPVVIRLSLTNKDKGRVAATSITATVKSGQQACNITLQADLVKGRYEQAKGKPALVGTVQLTKLETDCRSSQTKRLVDTLRKMLKRSPPTIRLELTGRSLCPEHSGQKTCLTPASKKSRP